MSWDVIKANLKESLLFIILVMSWNLRQAHLVRIDDPGEDIIGDDDD